MRKLLRRRWLRVVLPLGFAALALAPTGAAAVRVRAVQISGLPVVRLTIVAPAGSPTPSLRENGLPVVGFRAVNLGREKAIVLALDRSQSMRGSPFRHALAAARVFVSAAGASDHVGVVAFGRNAFALGGSSSPSAADNALTGLSVDASSGTALYDAVVIAANRLAGDSRPGRAIVVVTDGADVSSTNTIDDAIAAAQAAHAAVYAIGIAGPSFDPSALRRLAGATGGSYHQATSAAALSGVYAGLEAELARTWQLSYVSAARGGDHVHLSVAVPGAGTVTTALSLPGGASAPVPPTGLIPAAGYSTVGTIVVGLVTGFLVLLAVGFWFAGRRGNRVRARIEPHIAQAERVHPRHRRHDRVLRAHVSDGIENLFGRLRQFKRLQVAIDRADLPLRAGELVAISGCSMIFFGFVVAVAAAPTLVILVALLVGAAAPLAYVSFKAAGRIKQFDNQLPDLLITIAASLKAGHSFRQGMQAVVDEGADPAAKEFRRVLTENQLGKPMDDALLDLAARIESKNLTFVINAVTIQRQIGGSLAGLFDMIADTVRQRQQFARKVKGLTAMGRMSAYVLVALPFALAMLITMINPQYMAPLYHTSTGQTMIVAALVMIVIGSAILRKIATFRG